VLKAVDQTVGTFSRFQATFSKLRADGKLKELGSAASNVAGAVNKVGSEVFALSARLLGIGSVAAFAFGAIVKGATESLDKLGEVAQRTGTTVDFYASLQHAAGQADIEQDAFNTSLDFFNKSLGQAKAGGGPLLEFLKKVNPAFAEQIKNTTGVEQGISLMTDAFSKVTDPSKRAALATAAFGRSGAQMGVFLGQGSAAIQEAQRNYLALVGPQDKAVAAAGAFDNASKNAGAALVGLRNAAIVPLLPALTKIADAFSKLVSENRVEIEKFFTDIGDSISAWVADGGIGRLVEDLGELKNTILGIVDSVGGWKTVAAAFALFLAAPLISSIGGLVGSMWSLGAALLALGPMGLVITAIAAAIALVAGLAIYAYTTFQPLRDAVDSTFQPLKKAVLDLWEAFSGLTGGLGSDLMPVFDAIAQMVGSTVFAAFSAVINQLTFMVKVATELVNVLSLLKKAVGVDGIAATLNPLGGVFAAGRTLFGGAASVPTAGATPREQGPLQSEAVVTVNFSGAPAGTTTSIDPRSTATVDTGLNYTPGFSL
jgi:hypothetical protein